MHTPPQKNARLAGTDRLLAKNKESFVVMTPK
jgi:hypothetical protein